MMRRVRLPEPSRQKRPWLPLPAPIGLALIAALLTMPGAAGADEAKSWKPHRGVNLSNWLADAPRQPLFDHDFQLIKAAGFDHVRLPVNPEFLGFSLNEAATGRVLFDFAPVDRAVGLAMANGLSVILDIHPSEGFLGLIEQDARAEAGFIGLWEHLADHYKLYPPESLGFEILNAPRYQDDTARYGELMADIVSSMRQIVPKHLIIIDAPIGAAIDGLTALKPVKDGNVEYAFHFYEPEMFTRQGMNFGTQSRTVRYFRNLPYPSALANPTVNYAATAPDSTEARRMVQEYALADWNAGRIQARLRQAADWAQANHAQIICTEFGARRTYVNVAARYRWIADTRKALEADGIAWDVWDFSDMFGIVKLNGNTITEPGDGSVRFVDPGKGTREIETDATTALFGP